jgi:hypothetical protein
VLTPRTVEDLSSARHALDVLHALCRQRMRSASQQRASASTTHLQHITRRDERQPVARAKPRHQLTRAANTWHGARVSAAANNS